MAAVADRATSEKPDENMFTGIEAVDKHPDIERAEEVFKAFIAGDSLDVIAVKLGIPYSECATALHDRIAAAQIERKLLPELEAARIGMARKALLPAVLAGDVAAAKEYRQQGESLRVLFDANKRPELSDGPEVVIAFAFGSEGRVRVARPVSRPEADDLRPASDPVDRDRNEDGEDGGGVSLDLRGDRPR